MSVILTVHKLSKSFPGVQVLNEINIEFNKGEVHALVGENGAGKSTLMNIIYGVYSDYSGEIQIENQKVHFSSPLDAQAHGIAMVHQELSLIPYLSVMDNIYLGHYPTKGVFVDKRQLRLQTVELMKQLNIQGISPDVRINKLSIAQKQLIEIIKALSLNAKLILMDEPTASLTDQETENLMKTIVLLKEKGVAVVYVSHRLEEVFSISDRMSILRDGYLVSQLTKNDFNYETVIFNMIGHEIELYKRDYYNRHGDENVPIVMEVKNLRKKGSYEGISFSLKKGEVLGIGGLVGSGRSELLEGIFGYEPPSSGEVIVNGKILDCKHPNNVIASKVGLVPEDRKNKGIFPRLSLMQNINVVSYKELKGHLFINRKSEHNSAKAYVDRLRIRTPNVYKQIEQLSGGNQQKAILSRWLRIRPDILMLDEPTHGIDVGAKEDIYRIINELSNSGIAIVLVSSEMPELIRLSDRVLVMRDGKMQVILNHDEVTQENIGKFGMGQRNN